MTGAEIAPLVAILGAVALINLAFAWLFTRGDRNPTDFFGSARGPSEDATFDVRRDRDRGSDPESGVDPGTDHEAGTGTHPGQSRDGATDFAVPAGESGPPGEPPPLDAADETVVCRHCGAENRTGYRYCRWCVRSGFVDEGAGGAADAAMPNRSL
ncbi:DUF7577 domain-containing protein [Halorubrum lipolyticum]|uniref:DUF7577 domain-containing protein n=1 Tax=Halorubrum lipolyticum DSM 21995 TaxID=1227482 RepID=M0NV66_9EURY|nr:hypothetical protein [Halorubrum lipolyticum]EMA61458.1 hypothetical protein C469_07161 [Halorubrum lipolyticum DSM 21995]